MTTRKLEILNVGAFSSVFGDVAFEATASISATSEAAGTEADLLATGDILAVSSTIIGALSHNIMAVCGLLAAPSLGIVSGIKLDCTASILAVEATLPIGDASIVGVAGIIASGVTLISGDASLEGIASITAVESTQDIGEVALEGIASMSASGACVHAGYGWLLGIATVSATGSCIHSAEAVSLDGIATITATGVCLIGASTSLTAIATLSATGFITSPCGLTLVQRIYDSVAAQWVYYSTLGAPDPAPLPGATSPNHTGTLLAGSHHVLHRISAVGSGAHRLPQRVWDVTNEIWVYYDTYSTPDPAPAPSATSPNHSGSLLSGSHQVIEQLPDLGCTRNYVQRIYDSGNSVWVYYSTTGGPDSAPLSGATSPNHSGTLLTGSHHIIDVFITP